MILPGVSAPRRRSRFSLVYLVCRGARHKSGSGWTPNRAPTVREGLRHTHLLPAGGNPSLTVGAQIGVLPTLGFSRLPGIWPNPSHQCRAPEVKSCAQNLLGNMESGRQPMSIDLTRADLGSTREPVSYTHLRAH